MSYTAWSVIAGEIPTETKWNILGDNDDYFNTEIDNINHLWETPSYGSSINLDLANGTNKLFEITLTGNATLTLSNTTDAKVFFVRLKQGGTGSKLITWFSNIDWRGGVAPVLTTTTGRADVIGFLIKPSGRFDGYVVDQDLPN